eukprot:COSAG01_NODE_1570_length_9869_cov_360.007267_8_plen_78_part_00
MYHVTLNTYIIPALSPTQHIIPISSSYDFYFAGLSPVILLTIAREPPRRYCVGVVARYACCRYVDATTGTYAPARLK